MKIGVWIMLSLALSACSGEDRSLPPKYRGIPVPLEQLESSEARERGQALFEQHCVLCHGIRADGKGVRHRYLSGAPANFRSKDWRASTTPRRVYFVLREGVQGTSMPAWPTFEPEQTWDLAAYVLGVHEEGP